MHFTATMHFLYFIEVWLAPHCQSLGRACKILDVGSYDVNGNLKTALEMYSRGNPLNFTYTGLDMADGPNVDIVAINPWSWPMIDEGSFDIVISSSAFEHDPLFWLTFKELARVVQPGGWLYLQAPSAGFYHGHPKDCWRFFEDSWAALALWEPRFKCVSSGVQRQQLAKFAHISDLEMTWHDSMGVFQRRHPHEVPQGSHVERWNEMLRKPQERAPENETCATTDFAHEAHAAWTRLAQHFVHATPAVAST